MKSVVKKRNRKRIIIKSILVTFLGIFLIIAVVFACILAPRSVLKQEQVTDVSRVILRYSENGTSWTSTTLSDPQRTEFLNKLCGIQYTVRLNDEKVTSHYEIRITYKSGDTYYISDSVRTVKTGEDTKVTNITVPLEFRSLVAKYK